MYCRRLPFHFDVVSFPKWASLQPFLWCGSFHLRNSRRLLHKCDDSEARDHLQSSSGDGSFTLFLDDLAFLHLVRISPFDSAQRSRLVDQVLPSRLLSSHDRAHGGLFFDSLSKLLQDFYCHFSTAPYHFSSLPSVLV